MPDVFGLNDRVSVMKNGKTVGTYRTSEVTEDEVLGMIIAGKKVTRAVLRSGGEPALHFFAVASGGILPSPAGLRASRQGTRRGSAWGGRRWRRLPLPLLGPGERGETRCVHWRSSLRQSPRVRPRNARACGLASPALLAAPHIARDGCPLARRETTSPVWNMPAPAPGRAVTSGMGGAEPGRGQSQRTVLISPGGDRARRGLTSIAQGLVAARHAGIVHLTRPRLSGQVNTSERSEFTGQLATGKAQGVSTPQVRPPGCAAGCPPGALLGCVGTQGVKPTHRLAMRHALRHSRLRSLAAEAPLVVPRFVEETELAGLNSRFDGEAEFVVGGGVATFDCDGDGLPELYVTGGVNSRALPQSQPRRPVKPSSRSARAWN